MRPQSQPPQWHTSFNKATPTPTRPHFLIVPLPIGGTFKPMGEHSYSNHHTNKTKQIFFPLLFSLLLVHSLSLCAPLLVSLSNHSLTYAHPHSQLNIGQTGLEFITQSRLTLSLWSSYFPLMSTTGVGGWGNRWTDGWVDGWMGGWMSGWVDEWMGVWVDGWMGGNGWGMGGWIDGWTGGWMDRWMGRWMDGWMGIWVDGWMSGWMDGGWVDE